MEMAMIIFIGLILTIHVTLQNLRDGIQGDNEEK
jgi:hypothetical protein